MLSSAGDPTAILDHVHNPNLTQEQKIGVAAQQFEGVLLNLFLKDAMKPMLHQMPGSQAGGGVYQHYLTNVLADSITQAGGFGFSSVLQQQLTQNLNPNESLSSHEG